MVSKRRVNEEGHIRKFLVIVDESPESDRAIVYAAKRAERTGGLLDMLFVIEPSDFQHWLGVEAIMRAEAREAAEQALEKYAERARSVAKVSVETVIREGNTSEEISKLIEEDQDIAIMVLDAGDGIDGPGPLVSSLASRGSAFSIPVTVVPPDLKDEDIEALA